jgi:hypothetical protein
MPKVANIILDRRVMEARGRKNDVKRLAQARRVVVDDRVELAACCVREGSRSGEAQTQHQHVPSSTTSPLSETLMRELSDINFFCNFLSLTFCPAGAIIFYLSADDYLVKTLPDALFLAL